MEDTYAFLDLIQVAVWSTVRGSTPGPHIFAFAVLSGALENHDGGRHPGVTQSALAPGRGR